MRLKVVGFRLVRLLIRCSLAQGVDFPSITQTHKGITKDTVTQKQKAILRGVPLVRLGNLAIIEIHD